MKTMTPKHPRWNEFCVRLAGPEGCDFKDNHTWKCDNTSNRPFATAILKTMTEIDIAASMEYFDDNGGHCDCEILFNVDE